MSEYAAVHKGASVVSYTVKTTENDLQEEKERPFKKVNELKKPNLRAVMEV